MHGGDIYRNNIQFDFSVNINPMGVPPEVQWVLTEAALHANKYPDIMYLNRENDLNIEGLRRAKKSYRPAMLLKKYTASYLL